MVCRLVGAKLLSEPMLEYCSMVPKKQILIEIHTCSLKQIYFKMSYGKWRPFRLGLSILTHWGRVTHICVSDLTSTDSDNGLAPGWRQAIIWTNARILLIRPLGTNFSEFLVEILIFSFKKMLLKVSSAKRRPSCLGFNVLTLDHSDVVQLATALFFKSILFV